jgi:hypothetical protein
VSNGNGNLSGAVPMTGPLQMHNPTSNGEVSMYQYDPFDVPGDARILFTGTLLFITNE